VRVKSSVKVCVDGLPGAAESNSSVIGAHGLGEGAGERVAELDTIPDAADAPAEIRINARSDSNAFMDEVMKTAVSRVWGRERFCPRPAASASDQ
jgi:hypothetical protein